MKSGIVILVSLVAIALAAGCGSDADGGNTVNMEGFRGIETSRFGFFRGAGSYPYMEELGAHWQRGHPGPFVWGSIESEEGTYDWDEADAFVIDAQAHQVLIDATIWPYANWDQRQCHQELPNAPIHFMPALGDYRGKPCDMDAYKDFIRAMVERYDGDGEDDMPGLVYPVRYWEVVNEPSLDTDTPFFVSDDRLGDYREVLVATAGAIRDSDPEANVLNGGIASLEGDARDFWESILSAEGGSLIDVVTIHAVLVTPEQNLSALAELMSSLDLAKPVWVTEIRIAQGQGLGGHGERRPSADGDLPAPTPEQVAEQERWSAELVRQFVSAFGEGTDKLFYMGLDNATPTLDAARLINCAEVIGGELEEDRLQMSGCVRQKPFFAYRTMIDKLDYFDTVEKIAPGQYRFTVDGKPVYVLWGEGPVPAAIKDRVMVTDIYGVSTEADAGSIRLSGVPIYIEQTHEGGL